MLLELLKCSEVTAVSDLVNAEKKSMHRDILSFLERCEENMIQKMKFLIGKETKYNHNPIFKDDEGEEDLKVYIAFIFYFLP